jgi:DNA-directed RNA polymerase specialized sigma24 family protein
MTHDTVLEAVVSASELDAESARWLQALAEPRRGRRRRHGCATCCCPSRDAEWRDLATAVRRAVDTELTPRQRQVFVAIILNGVPLDALVASRGSSRSAIYTMMFDARRKLRAALAANGYLPDDSSRGS